MANLSRLSGFLFSAALVTACGDDPSFVQREKDPVVEQDEDLIAETSQDTDEDVSAGDQNQGEEPADADFVRREFIQGGPGKVDILWVIDNSSSMRPFQTSLRANIEAFVESLAASKLDFQMGVTSTDICGSKQPLELAERACPEQTTGAGLQGKLVGAKGRKVLKNHDTDLIQRFKQYANLGTTGSSFEHGLSAARLAADLALAGENEGLLRADAFLSIVVVSDEEDDGVGLARTNEDGVNYWERGVTRYRFTAEDLVTHLTQLKGRNRFSLSTIVGTRDGAGALCGDAYEEGLEYLKAATQTAGLSASICSANWSHTLRQIGEGLQTQIESISLENRPLVETIRIYVNDQLYPHWIYNAAANLVQFTAGHVPAEHAHIALTYTKAS